MWKDQNIKDTNNVLLGLENDEAGIGQMLLPFCSLINHSSNPNVGRCSLINQGEMLYARCPIEENEQVKNAV